MKNNIFTGILISLLIVVLMTPIWGVLVRKPDMKINEDNKYIYVKEYSMFNCDSSIHKYHKDVYYNVTIIDKRKSSGFVGVVGKGGHVQTWYFITIKYETGEIEEYKDRHVYHNYEIGNKLIMKEIWYPYHDKYFLINEN